MSMTKKVALVALGAILIAAFVIVWKYDWIDPVKVEIAGYSEQVYGTVVIWVAVSDAASKL